MCVFRSRRRAGRTFSQGQGAHRGQRRVGARGTIGPGGYPPVGLDRSVAASSVASASTAVVLPAPTPVPPPSPVSAAASGRHPHAAHPPWGGVGGAGSRLQSRDQPSLGGGGVHPPPSPIGSGSRDSDLPAPQAPEKIFDQIWSLLGPEKLRSEKVPLFLRIGYEKTRKFISD